MLVRNATIRRAIRGVLPMGRSPNRGSRCVSTRLAGWSRGQSASCGTSGVGVIGSSMSSDSGPDHSSCSAASTCPQSPILRDRYCHGGCVPGSRGSRWSGGCGRRQVRNRTGAIRFLGEALRCSPSGSTQGNRGSMSVISERVVMQWLRASPSSNCRSPLRQTATRSMWLATVNVSPVRPHDPKPQMTDSEQGRPLAITRRLSGPALLARS
jgi:hypothetical protein